MSAVHTARRVLRRPVGLLSAAWLCCLVAVAARPGLVTATDPLRQDLPAALQGPSTQHPLGTDMLGRDLLSRLAYGAGDALGGLVVAVSVAVVVGVALGLLAGFAGGVVDTVVARTADVLFALPNIVILLLVVAIYPSNTTVTMSTFGLLAAPGLMRIVRGATLAIKQEQFVAAARVLGLSDLQILRRHLLPRLAGLILIQTSLVAALALVLQSGLGFLGFGVQAPAPSWGGLINDAVAVLGRDPWALVPPGAAIGVTALALALLGDAIRDASAAAWSVSKLQPARRSRVRSSRLGSTGPEAPPAPLDDDVLLDVSGLTVELPIGGRSTTVVDDLSLTIGRGEVVGLVGESGCGKSVSVLSLLGLVPGGGTVVAGRCTFDGRDLRTLSSAQLARVRGSSIAYISQEPIQRLDPTFRVG